MSGLPRTEEEVKTYFDLLAETPVPAFGDRDICWYLKQPSYDVFRKDIIFNPNGANSTKGMHITINRFLRSLIAWKQGSPVKSQRSDLDSFAQEHIMSCPSSGRAPWTKHVGKAYRGLMKTPSTIGKLKLRFTGEVTTVKASRTNAAPFTALIAMGKYKSSYRYQSWATIMDVAYEFATGGAQGMMTKTDSKIGMVLEMDLKPSDNTMFIDTFPQMGKEHEVIVESSAPASVVVYVNLDDLSYKLVTWISKDKYVVDEAKARKLLGTSYELLMKSPQFISYMKKKFDIDAGRK
jgi:hypothetical protein